VNSLICGRPNNTIKKSINRRKVVNFFSLQLSQQPSIVKKKTPKEKDQRKKDIHKSLQLKQEALILCKHPITNISFLILLANANINT
jgi:hypothetical protein